MVKKTSKKETTKKAPKEEPESAAEEASEEENVQYSTAPQSAFFMFAGDHRPKLLAESAAKNEGKAKVGDVAKIIGELWSKCSETDRKPYMARNEKDKKRYEKELASGMQKKPRKSKKGKKEKKKKDPNAPKRPMSSYFMWLSKNRDSIIKEYKLDKGKVTEVMKKAGELWKDVDQETKAGLQKQAEKSNLVYVKEKEKYLAKLAAEAA